MHIKNLAPALAVCALALSLSLLSGCAPSDSMRMAFDTKGGQPVPQGLPEPEKWTYLGAQTIPGRMQAMAWEKPGAVREKFEYQDLPRPDLSPQKYLEDFKARQAQACPSFSVTPLRVTEKELLLKVTSGGCARFGEMAEIDRYIFGKTDLFHMSYMVTARDLTAAQRDAGIKAVTAWNMN